MDPRDPFSVGNKLFRLFWRVTWLLVAEWTPPIFAPWRRLVLRVFGAHMEAGADVRGTASVWLPANLMMEKNTIIAQKVRCYNQAKVTLRAGSIVSQGAYLCASGHDTNSSSFPLIASAIEIGGGAWIAAEAFVGPGVIVGEGSVLGARAVTFRSLEPWTIYIGNPAVPMRKRVIGNY